MPGYLFGSPLGASFTPAWQSLKVSGGGDLTGITAYSDGTIVTRGDSFGASIYVPTGTVVQDGTTWTAPAWKYLITSDSLPLADVTFANGYSLNTGAVEVAVAPGNTNVIYVWIFNTLYVSTNRGVSFTQLMGGLGGGILTFNPNGQSHTNNSWIAVDPGNAAVVYLCTPSNGTYVNTAGTSGGSWTHVTQITNTSGTGGNVVFDPTSAFTGGKTQRIVVFVDGVSGAFQSTDGGANFSAVTAGSPPLHVTSAICDKFGQIWAVESFSGTAGAAYKFASSTWTQYAAATGSNNQVTGIVQDPNSASVGANQMVITTWQGWLWATVNGGTVWTEVATGGTNVTIGASAPQAIWQNTINQYFSHSTVQLNVTAMTMHPSGTIFAATGIDCWTTPTPIVSGVIQSSVAWAANNVGIDQLVNNTILSAPGNSPLLANWDRALILCKNPDKFPAVQFPDKNTAAVSQIIIGGWNSDYAGNKPATVVSILAGQGGGTYIATTADGGNTWSLLSTLPAVGVGLGGVIATSTDQIWACIPGDGSGQNTVIYFTANAGTSWTLSSFTGSPGDFIALNAGHSNNRQPLCADSTTAGTFYLIDVNQKVFKTTNNGANWAATGATSAQFNSFVQQDRLLCPPKGVGTFNTAGHVYYAPQSGNLFKSTNNAANFSAINATMDNVVAFGFGAPKAGGNGYPTIYAYQGAGTLASGFYQSVDGGTTWTACLLPAGEQNWPYHLLDYPQWLTGDVNVYGRIYIGVKGFTGTYIDTSDAYPWVNFSNVNPGASLTGTVTLSAEHSGLVPVTGVQFSVDGVNIGSVQTGAGPYSVSWVTGGVATGAHTLKVAATGVNGTGSFSIPITTT